MCTATTSTRVTPLGLLILSERRCRWRQSIRGLNLDPIVLTCDGALTTYGDHLNHISLLPLCQQGPYQSRRRQTQQGQSRARSSSSRQPLDVLEIRYLIGLGGLFSNADCFLAQRHAPLGDFSCCGSRVLDDYIIMLTRSLFISNTWSPSSSTFTAILPYPPCLAVLHWTVLER